MVEESSKAAVMTLPPEIFPVFEALVVHKRSGGVGSAQQTYTTSMKGTTQ